MLLTHLLPLSLLLGGALASKRADWVLERLGELESAFPGKNIFLYHAHHDEFRWSTANAHIFDTEYRYGSGFGDKNEYFAGIVFEGEGSLENRADGGYENWAFSGNCVREGMKAVCH